MIRCLLFLVALLGVAIASAKDVPFKGFTVSLPDGVSAEVATNDNDHLMVSWSQSGTEASAFWLSQQETVTNVPSQTQKRLWALVLTETHICKMIPTFKQMILVTNQVALGPGQATELLVTATYRDRDFGTMRKAYWIFPGAGCLWQAQLPMGGNKDVAKARRILEKAKLPAPNSGAVGEAPRGPSPSPPR